MHRHASVVATASLLLGLLPACAPLYSAKPEALRKMGTKSRPADADVEVKWTTECEADFFADATRVKRNKPLAASESGRADAALLAAPAKDDPIVGILDAIDKYKGALVADPYSAEATKGLAVAYAKVRFKGCALKLLTRLSELSENPEFQADANRMVDSAAADSAFDGFRNEADAALGR